MIGKIKDQRSKIKNSHQTLKRYFFVFFLFLLILFLLLNIFASQRISSVYFQLINNKRPATVEFLKRINRHPQFVYFLKINKNIFGRYLEDEVFNEQKLKEEEIAQLQSLLTKNPKSREILYRLYLINKELGNDQEAEKYLKMAKEVDPDIN